MTNEIINNQVKQLENEKLFKDLDQKNRRAEWSRKYYVNNREKIIKKHIEYNKNYERHNSISNLHGRIRYYFKKGYFNNGEDTLNITNYLINNNLSIKFIEYVKYWFELIEINYS